jgi:hypothetical protein
MIEENSAREDVNSIYYVVRKGRYAVSFIVLKVGDEYVACNLTAHTPSPVEAWCNVLETYGSCPDNPPSVARAFYARLQQSGKTERVDDARVFDALATYLHDEVGT